MTKGASVPFSPPESATEATGDVIRIVDDNLRHGFAQMPRPVLRAKGLSLKAKVIYMALLDYAWQAGSCFPGQQRLAEAIDASVDTVQRALQELKQYGLIAWHRQGLNKPNVYFLLRLGDNPRLPLVQPAPQAQEHQRRQRVHPARGGNRKLRSPDTAGVRYQETANGGAEEYAVEKDSDHHQPQVQRSPTGHPRAPAGACDDDLVQLLTERGIGKRQAHRLAHTHPHVIRQKVAELTWRITHRPHTVGKNPAGFLISSIQHPEDYPAPPELVSAEAATKRRVALARQEAARRDQELRDEAKTHLIPPAKRAQAWLLAWEQGLKVLRKPQPAPEERASRLRQLTETYAIQAAAFFAKHPELRTELHTEIAVPRQVGTSEHSAVPTHHATSPP